MKPLTSLVRHAEPGDPLAQAVGALLASGLVVTTRDGAGRYVQLSEAYGKELGIQGLEGRGSTFLEGYQFFDADGNELPRMEHPAHVARITGVPQHLQVSGVRAPNGREAWTVNSYMPLERDEDGWQVLTVGVPLPRSVFHPPTQEAAREPFQRPLLEFALAVAGARMCGEQLAEAMRPAVEAIADDPLSISLLVLREGMLHLLPVVRYTDVPVTPVMRMGGEAAVRWQMNETYYNPNIGEADVIGDRVVIELAHPVRSFAVIPLKGVDGRRVASIGVTAPVPHAMSPQQRCALEQLARLAGPALAEGLQEPPEGW